MTITSFDTILAQGAGGELSDPFYIQNQTARTASFFTGQNTGRGYYPTGLRALPALSSTTTYFMPTNLEAVSNNQTPSFFYKITLLGTLDISTPAYTHNSSAPTITEGGISRALPSAVMAVVTSSLSSAPGSFTVTYTNQDGVSNTTASAALTGSAAVNTAGFINLLSSDWGAIDISSATRTSGTTPTGIIKFYNINPVAIMISHSAGVLMKKNFLTDFPQLMKFSSGDQVAVFNNLPASTVAIEGAMTFIAMP